MKILMPLILLLLAPALQADRLVLVQGYLGHAGDWARAGISQQLQEQNWPYAGHYEYGDEGTRLFASSGESSPNGFYTVELPTEASLTIQAFYLQSYLRDISRKFPHERLILAGHSAGGVLARLVMVRNPELNFRLLVTIASPHLGTDSAELGRWVGQSPLVLFAPMVGADTLNRSQSLYRDLLPERPETFLFWLNRQPHPVAEYYSIVRDHRSPNGGDLVVPAQSQFLENVYALRDDRANSYIVSGTHTLVPDDGRLLLDILNETFLRPI